MWDFFVRVVCERECEDLRQDPRNILFCQFIISETPYLYPHYIYPHYPHMLRSAFQRENPSHKLWELEIIIPTILYTILCGFPQLLPLHFHILERLIAPTLTTPILSVKWGFGASEKHWKMPSFGGCNRAYCRIRKVRQDTVLRSLVGVGAWRA